mgnify:CR=1 FL=1
MNDSMQINENTSPMPLAAGAPAAGWTPVRLGVMVLLVVAAAADTGRLQARWRDEISQRLKDRPQTVRQIFVAQYAREWRLLESGRAGDLEPRTLVETAQSLLAVPDLAR